MNRRLQRRLRATRTGESGFTIVELTVAMFITLLVVTSLIGVFISSLTGVALSKQRQAASSLATGVLEQIRALDYGTLSAGMVCSDLTSDTRITISGTCGSGGTVTFAPGISGISEPVKVQASTPATAVPPIFPHRTTTGLEGVTYDVGAYVTRAATTEEAFNLTVLVSWSSPVSKGTKTVIQRSVEYSPTRCLSSATHPYTGACQAAYRGDAGTTNAGVRVINPDDPAAPIVGLGGSELSLTFPTLSATVGSEQINKLSGTVGTSIAERLDGTTTTASAGGDTKTAAADTDPSSADAFDRTVDVAQPTGLSPAQVSGIVGALQVLPSSGDAGTMTSRTASSGTSCTDASGSPIANAVNLPCTSGSVRAQGDAGTVVLKLAQGAPNFAVASFGGAPSASRAAVSRIASAGGTACPTASGTGCITTQVSRTVGDVMVGGLPSGTLPSGWSGGLVKVTGVSESAFAESGPGARVDPKFTRSGGILSTYNGTSGYQNLDLTTLSADTQIVLPTVTGTSSQGGHTAVVTISGSVRAGGKNLLPGSVTAPDAACKASACEKRVAVSSTITANLVYTVTVDGLPATRFAVVVDLGSVLARSSYKAAFDA